MYPSLTGPLPKSSYLRLLEYQRQRMVFPAYAADLPLLLFIFFSRIAAGLSILSVFFPHSASLAGHRLLLHGPGNRCIRYSSHCANSLFYHDH